MKKHKTFYLLYFAAQFNLLIVIFRLTSALTATNSTKNSNNRYLWNDLVAVPTAVFERAFLPSYVDFETVLQQTTLYNRTEKNATKNDQTTTGNYSSKGENLAISANCQSSLLQTLTALRARRTWAVKMFSSWGRLPPAGMASGTLTDLGEYDQCRNSMGDWQESLESFSEKSTPSSFHPQYCLLDAAFPLPPLPRQHNYFQAVEGLLPSGKSGQDFLMADKQLQQQQLQMMILSYNSSNNSSSGTKILSNTPSTLYQTLQQHASVLYYAQLKVGICLPNSCTEADIRLVAEQSK
mgnify:CR=1 FL=1